VTATPPAAPPLDFERALRDLETLVSRMEQGEFSLEESIEQFERGVALVRACQQALAAAEQKVRKLTTQGGEDALEDFSGNGQE